MLKKTLYIFLLVCCQSLLADGQAVYSGQITDVGSRLTVSGVEMQLANSVVYTQSDFDGNFLIKNEAVDSVVSPKNKYQFFNQELFEGFHVNNSHTKKHELNV